MNMKIESRDVAIIGAGPLGLETAKLLSGKGYGLSVVVFEKSPTVANGPATRNNRTLHAGTFHGAQSSREAVTVGQQVRRGFEAISAFAPEAVDPTPSHILLFSEEDANRAVAQWSEAGVEVRPVLPRVFQASHPEINVPGLAAVFSSEDRTLNTIPYYQKLIRVGQANGVQYVTGANVRVEDGNTLTVNANGETFGLRAQTIIVTAGYGIAQVYREVTGDDPPMRYFKSHLLTFPDALTGSNILSVGADRIMSQNINDGGRGRSIVGVNYDYEVGSPDFDAEKAELAEGYRKIREGFPGASPDYQGHACVKPSIVMPGADVPYSLDIKVLQVPAAPTVLFALPGKMTVAPIAAQEIASRLHMPTTGEVALINAANPDPQVTAYPYSRS